MLKKLFLSLFFIAGFAISSANANIKIIVPSDVGTGTSIWASHISKVLTEKLGEPVILVHIGAAKGRVAIEKFNNEYKNDPDVIMLVHGGNANQWLITDVGYDFRDWNPLLIQPYNVITTIRFNDLLDSVFGTRQKINIADCSGCIPETLAWAQLFGWDKLNIIKKMSPGVAKKAWLDGELFYIREPVSRHLKNTDHLVNTDTNVVRFFNHGLLTVENGQFTYGLDRNFSETLFEEIYLFLNGEDATTNEMYNAYFLAKAWRDGLQKGLFVHPDNPNYERLVSVIAEVLNDENAMAYLNEKLGEYPIYTGSEADKVMSYLYSLVNEKDLRELVTLAKENMGWSTAIFDKSKVKN